MKIDSVAYLGETPVANAAARDITALFLGVSPPDEKSGGTAITLRSKIEDCHGAVRVYTELCPEMGKANASPLSAERASSCADEDRIKAVNRLIRLNVFQLLQRLTGENPSPWGILRGVRPTKLVHKLLDAGKKRAEIIQYLEHNYAVAADKAILAADTALRERPFLPVPEREKRQVAVYIGIPFCPTRCLYCSFPASILPPAEQVAAFLAALRRDMQDAAAAIAGGGWKVQSIYIGGGTPTSLGEREFRQLLVDVRKLFWDAATIEFTVEAGRPDSITDEKILAMRDHGVTRVSVNPQTMQENTLKRIGRNHSVQDIITIFGKIRQAAPFLVNMDLIAGLPGETAVDMADTLDRITVLKPDNLTVHTLAIKKGSVLKDLGCGLTLPGEATVKMMLEGAARAAAEMGLESYYLYRQKYMTGNFENIGYARPGAYCLYNMQIIEERQTIVGIGPGAGTKAVNVHTWRLKSHYHPKDLRSYLAHLDMHLRQRRELLACCAQN